MEIKTARNWYWWLWLSPFLTLPTLLLILFDSLWYGNTTPLQAVTGVLLSGAWHLVLLIPARNKTSNFIRWHGRQMLILAGIRTALALLVCLLPESNLSVVIVFILFIFWFSGTLVFQLETSKGYCSLWRWFGDKNQPLLDLASLEESAWTAEVKVLGNLDIDGLVEIIRFSKDKEQRQTALKELERLGLVENLQEPAIGLVEEAQRSANLDPKAYIDPLPTQEPAKGKGISPLLWVGMGLVVLICIFLGTGYSMISSPPNSYNTPTPTAIPKTLTPKERKRQIAKQMVDEIESLVYGGMIEEALHNLNAAQQVDPLVHLSARTWNNLCWWGSLNGYPEEVYDACEMAVAMEPMDGGIRDSRGLARALLGDYEGAIKDFESFVSMANVNEIHAAKRQSWIEDLEKGINPFDEETLEALKQE